MANPTSEDINRALQLGGDADKIRDYYREWAKRYDDDVTGEGYHAPAIVAELAGVAQLGYAEQSREELRVMDAGCGTGLTGVALRAAGFRKIDGFDISPEMVAESRATGAYDTLITGTDLNLPDAGLGYWAETYDIVTCVGVFTLGHVGPEGFEHLVAITKPGGFLVTSARDDYVEETGIAGYLANLEGESRIETLQHLSGARYVGPDRADYWVHRKAGR